MLLHITLLRLLTILAVAKSPLMLNLSGDQKSNLASLFANLDAVSNRKKIAVSFVAGTPLRPCSIVENSKIFAIRLMLALHTYELLTIFIARAALSSRLRILDMGSNCWQSVGRKQRSQPNDARQLVMLRNVLSFESTISYHSKGCGTEQQPHRPKRLPG